ncbi:hypothetical protein RHGRI_027504 [Rhododendron griersonianum]|uniref:Uncharacterized protein n=1 Tax=Rhododendron griersonianum TaxID=479676 RepID=A0AAV6J3N2_9ERIC|nr:hypothetical protein RHGRI_027504 [Rhododendron griersonianum]
MSTISGITMLNKFNVKDVGALEERVVDLGMPETMGTIDASSSIPGDHVTVGETGPITDASVSKSKAVSEPTQNEAVASSKPKSKEFHERVEEWFDIIFCRQENIIKEQKRIRRRVDYGVTKLEDQFGAPYFSEGEEEDPTYVPDSDKEEEDEEDEEDEDDENDD